MQHVNGNLWLVQLQATTQHSHLSRATPKEAATMASVLIQLLDALFALIEGLFHSQSCCSQTQSKDQRLKTIQHQSLAACGKTDEASYFGFSLSHTFSPGDGVGVHS